MQQWWGVFLRFSGCIFQNGMILLMKYTLCNPMEGKKNMTDHKTVSSKHFVLISCVLLLFMGFFSPAPVAAEDWEWDDTTVRGDSLGENEVREFNTSHVYVIGKKLFMHESSDLASTPVQVLGTGDFVELLGSESGALYVRDTVGSSNGDITCIDGWVDERFVAITNRCYVAMQPTPIMTAPDANAKIICMLDTYDSSMIIDEINGYYCALVNGGIGYVLNEELVWTGTGNQNCFKQLTTAI